jgi:CubicO group peptidase (beta-lactamase class C family)
MNILKISIIIIVSALIVFEAYLLYTQQTYVNKVITKTIFKGRLSPDIDELDWYNSNKIEIGQPTVWPYKNKQISIDETFVDRMKKYQTVSYLVIQDDSIIYEKFFEGYDEKSYINSFSMAKSIISILIGCAIHDGLLTTIDTPAYHYVTALAQGNKKHITIRHLLTMSSGLDFDETYMSPFAWPSEAYYGNDVNNITTRADIKDMPGKIWKYKGGDTQLLGMILKNITGKSISQYASEKLWQPLGASNPAYWSIDEQGMEKVSCCWYSNAKDFARLAKLIMQHGRWNDVQILDSEFVANSILPASYLVSEANGNAVLNYGYQWWLMQYKGNEIFYARGIRGQYIFAIPDRNMIVVRLGHKRGAVDDNNIPIDIYVYLDAAFSLIN